MSRVTSPSYRHDLVLVVFRDDGPHAELSSSNISAIPPACCCTTFPVLFAASRGSSTTYFSADATSITPKAELDVGERLLRRNKVFGNAILKETRHGRCMDDGFCNDARAETGGFSGVVRSHFDYALGPSRSSAADPTRSRRSVSSADAEVPSLLSVSGQSSSGHGR